MEMWQMNITQYEHEGWDVAYVDLSFGKSLGMTRVGMMKYKHPEVYVEPVTFKITLIVGSEENLSVIALVCMADAPAPTWEIAGHKAAELLQSVGLFNDIDIETGEINEDGTNLEYISLDDKIADYLRGLIDDD